MAVIGLAGRKGGTGKSTIAANLAAELEALGRTVAVLDSDPQGSLVAWARLGEGLLSRAVQPIDTADPATFRATVESVARTSERVLIDTPPGFTDPALLAALLADLVLIPATPSPLDILAAREALELAREARSRRRGRRPAIRFVPSKVQTGTTLARDLPASLDALGRGVLPAVGQRVVVAESVLVGLTVREHAPRSVAAEEFEALARAVEELL